MADIPCNLLALRRSSRTIEKLCNGVQIKTHDSDGDVVTLDPWYTGLLLALSHCTGWTADYIALEIKKYTGLEFTAEDIWSFHGRWVMDRGTQVELSQGDLQAMLWVLKQEGFMLPELGRPLHMTEKPVSFIPKHCFYPLSHLPQLSDFSYKLCPSRISLYIY
jgi:hypothetical protein